jgi:NADPH:quinone reductase-like Zn-dependent oxidoreductase
MGIGMKCTAFELMKGAKLKRGDRVLVSVASEGVGHLVLQICCAAVVEAGRVLAVCSSGGAEWIRELGVGVEVRRGAFVGCRRCVELVRQQA